MRTNFNSHGVTSTFPPTRGNMITKEYYQHLVGEINNKTVNAAVCRIHYEAYDYTTYHLISIL